MLILIVFFFSVSNGFFSCNNKNSMRTQTLTKSSNIEEWIKKSGGYIGGISIFHDHENPSERQVRAVRDLAAGELVLAIPRACLVTLEMGKNTQFGRDLSVIGIELDDVASYLALVICHELTKTNEERYNSYISNFIVKFLPVQGGLGHFPIFWSDSEKVELQGSVLTELLGRRMSVLRGDFNKLVKFSPSFSSVSWNDFLWAHSAVSSRTFSFNEDFCGYSVAMIVPYADMFNDKISPEMEWDWDEESDRFTVRTRTTVNTGAPLHISYGYLPNYARLLNYGYTLDQKLEDDDFRAPEEYSHQVLMQVSLFDLSSRFVQINSENLERFVVAIVVIYLRMRMCFVPSSDTQHRLKHCIDSTFYTYLISVNKYRYFKACMSNVLYSFYSSISH